MKVSATLRNRIVICNGTAQKSPEILEIPSKGTIGHKDLDQIQALATQAASGKIDARDRLFFSLKPRLDIKSWLVRPWPNTPELTGVWDRDDVEQESWLIFIELLESWNGEESFVPYLFARFAWRLRDRILRGIGKSQNQLGTMRVPETLLKEMLTSEDSVQPERAALAKELIANLMERVMTGALEREAAEAWLELVNDHQHRTLSSPGFVSDAIPLRKVG